jgi:hypothetical protein
MRLQTLKAGKWTIVAPLDAQGRCEVLDALAELGNDPKTRATAAGFVALWGHIPIEGPRSLGTDNYHRVDDNNDIYEFIKGNHRLLCFQAEGRVVVCSHVIRKKSQKTPAAEKKRAAKLRDEYLAAKKAGAIEFVP